MSIKTNDLYQALRDAGLSSKDITQKLEAKAEEYQGYLSKEAILFLIAKEYGLNVQSSDIDSYFDDELKEKIDFNEYTIKISDIKENLINILLLGRIERKIGIKDFIHKDGTPVLLENF